VNPLNDFERFRFRLAKHLNKSLSEIDEMPYSEFLSWYEFNKVEPFNTQEIQMAQLLALTFNIHSKEPKSPMEFMLSVSDEDIAKAKQDALTKRMMEDL